MTHQEGETHIKQIFTVFIKHIISFLICIYSQALDH